MQLKLITGKNNASRNFNLDRQSNTEFKARQFLSKDSPKKTNRKKIEVIRKLETVNNVFQPTNEFDLEQINKAIRERQSRTTIFKPSDLAKRTSNQTNKVSAPINKGATKPPQNYNAWANLLTNSSANQKSGIGNVAMGGTFKSIYLAQGRKNANSKTFGKKLDSLNIVQKTRS